jgi:hypothetical protein
MISFLKGLFSIEFLVILRANVQTHRVKACFVNTDKVPAREMRKGDRINNPIEADIAFQVRFYTSLGLSDANSE